MELYGNRELVSISTDLLPGNRTVVNKRQILFTDSLFMLPLVPYRNRHQTDTKFVEAHGPIETVSADGCQRRAEMPLPLDTECCFGNCLKECGRQA
jgi:hypothetical protein